MKIIGTVENIIFRNDENMYTVLDIESSDILVTATGIFPSIAEGETVELFGDYKESKYGLQFVVSNYNTIGFQNVDAIARFLSGGLFKGVGEVTAKLITDRFGLDTFDVIEKTPEKLSMIKGISAKKAADIANSYKDVFTLREAVIYLTEKGISFNLALKIFNEYKDKTISTVNKNPYSLVEDIDGVGFKTADEVATKIGIDKDSDFRIRAGLVYILKDNADKNGSTCMPFESVVNSGRNILGYDFDLMDEKFSKVLSDMKMEGRIKEFILNDVKTISLSVNYFLEKNLASALIDIQNNAEELHLDVDFDIKEFEKKEKIKLHNTQKEAVKLAVNSGLSIITGGPGTGKTTIIKCILYIFKKLGKKVALVAPTGRAAKRLSESTDEEASTIHRLLDLDYKNGKGYFTYNEDTKLEQDVLIVDEVSMTDVYVMKSLINAVKFGGRVLLVGDKDQLPSVGAGNVLKDILDSGIFPVVKLTHIYRQGDGSMIITNAHKINEGEMPDLANNASDFFYSSISEQSKMQERIVEMVTTTLPKFSNLTSEDIQVLAPMKKGVVGIFNLNRVLQQSVNPKSSDKEEISFGDTLFRVGDRVMQTVNNYQTEWTKEENNRLNFGKGVYNGDIGKIIDINPKDAEITVLLEDGRNVLYDRTEINELTLSYAITIHKSQGSEFEIVIIPITGGSPSLYTRNLLYTGVTRAKKMVVLMGDKYNIMRMVQNNYIEKRFTMLKNFLVGEKL